MRKLGYAFLIFLLSFAPVLGSFCCGTEFDPNVRKCYSPGLGYCCNWRFSPTSCYDFSVLAYGPGGYTIGQEAPILVQIDNLGKYGDAFELSYEIVARCEIEGTPCGGYEPNPNLIHVDMEDEDYIEIEAGGIGFLNPRVTVISDTTNDCINISAHSIGSDIVKGDATCIDFAEPSISLSEFAWSGLILMFLVAGTIIILKPRI